ncbi:hypothetical protein H4F98_00405 [Lysobacter spongiae]|uniref:SGNH/GDSL hydrolase family protein n=2 Tax=Marilutibacter spongiae TaxID=2025720 RepID=A0A7W3TIM4_9GAMM|nr:hypothetical protein [Lysobacter spongiae]
MGRIFILGSCVSRDAFELPGHGFELSGYLARSSLGSAFLTRPAPAPMLAAATEIKSPFQRRMVETDLNKRASSVLRRGGFDFVLLDLIDERFPLADFGTMRGEPGLATLSLEFARASRWRGRRIAPGSTEHVAAWRRGVRRLLRLVPPGRIILNKAFWAGRFEDGKSLPEPEKIAASNRHLATMYAFLARAGITKAIDYPGGPRASPTHRWGVAPFHYSEATYRWMLDELARICCADNKALEESGSSIGMGLDGAREESV